jgi:hypothetical protein
LPARNRDPRAAGDEAEQERTQNEERIFHDLSIATFGGEMARGFRSRGVVDDPKRHDASLGSFDSL